MKKEYKAHIGRFYDSIRAEIYYISGENEIYVIHKHFRKFLSEPDEETYKRANRWATNVIQLQEKHGR